jgi:protein arginine kinase activator
VYGTLIKLILRAAVFGKKKMPEDTNMKMCDECGINPANIHLTQIMQNQTRIHHLCQECARKMGINISVNVEESGSGQEVTESDKSCGRCGMNYSEFRSKGWLGCAECYHAFEKEIDEMLIQVHGSAIHKGKQYHKSNTRVKATADIKRLRHELAAAIKNEQFEQAALLRDAIHNLKKTEVE